MTEVNSTKILDLDDFVPADRTVVINKKEYRIRGNATLEMTLKLMSASEIWSKNVGDTKSLQAMLTSIKMFFIDGVEDGVVESLDLANQIPKLIAFLYGREVKETEAPGNGPTKPE